MRWNKPVLAYIAGKAARFTSQDHNFRAGETIEKQVIVVNNSRQKVACECLWIMVPPGSTAASSGESRVIEETSAVVETGEQARIPLRYALPRDLKPGTYDLALRTGIFTDFVVPKTGDAQIDTFTINVLPAAPKPQVAAKLAVFDPKGETKKLLSELGIQYSSVGPDADTAAYDILVIGKHALTMSGPKLDLSRVRAGLKVIMFEQTTDVLERRLGFRVQEYGLRQVFPRVPANVGVLAGLTAENLRDWRGEGTTVPPRLETPTSDMGKYPEVQWCGFTAPRPWRCGCQGTVATVLIEKPTSGDFLPLVDGGFALQYSPLLEYREGAGMVMFCQLDVTGRSENDPAATRLVSNLLGYVSSWKPTPACKLLYVGEPAGKAHLEHANLSPADYQGGPLTPDQVLVVGPGGGAKLAAGVKEIEPWLKAGGRLLAVGLDQDEANALLPCKVATKKAQYVCGSYSVPALDGPFAGIAPADLYNRDPRQLPLVSGVAATLGDGVLAKADSASVVYCQLVPWQFDYAKTAGLKPTFQRASFALGRLLGNMGIRPETPLLANIRDPLPGRAMLDDVPNVVWLEAGDKVVFLPKVWKGLWVGSAEPPKGWETGGYNDGQWRDVKVPGAWQDQFKDIANVNGVFLYRTVVDVPADVAQQEVTFVVGAVDDEDSTYVNGQFVGSVNQKTNPRDYWQAVRRYKLPNGLLKAGPNVVAVKNNDLKGTGGMKASLLKRKGAGSARWLSGLYLDKPEAIDDPYRYYRW